MAIAPLPACDDHTAPIRATSPGAVPSHSLPVQLYFPLSVLFGLSVFFIALTRFFWLCFTTLYTIKFTCSVFLILAIVCARVDPVALVIQLYSILSCGCLCGCDKTQIKANTGGNSLFGLRVYSPSSGKPGLSSKAGTEAVTAEEGCLLAGCQAHVQLTLLCLPGPLLRDGTTNGTEPSHIHHPPGKCSHGQAHVPV